MGLLSVLRDVITNEQVLPYTHERGVIDDGGNLPIVLLKEETKQLNKAVSIPVNQNVNTVNGYYKHVGTLPPVIDNTTLPNSFKGILLNVKEGERYKLDLYAWGTGVTVYQVFSDKQSILDGGKSTTTPTHREIEVEIPKGGKTMFVNGYSNYPLNVYKYEVISGQMVKAFENGVYYKITDGNITLRGNYGDEKIEVTFGKRGSNNLPDFRTIKVGNDVLVNNETDWHSPFRVGAINNINGDQPNATTFYTGGNHNYSNESGNYDVTKSTARCSNLVFAVDGVIVGEGDFGYCNKVTISWVNYVQGYNTTKSTGGGREIIKEYHLMTYDGVEFVSTVNLVPLEDVSVISYFGYQVKLNSFYNKLRFIGGSNRLEYTNLTTTSYKSGNNKPNAIYAYGDKHSITLEVDRDYDLGRSDLYDGDSGMFTTTNPKGYSNLIANAVLHDGEIYSARGVWRFAPVRV